ncbi:MAG TPA: class I SAM-dependent methyltransferase [Ktedonobacterales bacterium]|nr:class I SAM-dependent methyltransferase [Ktedonobacterales bacterium]
MLDQLDDTQRELARITEEYHRRAAGQRVPPGAYSLFNDAALLHVHGIERALLDLLRRHHLTDLVETTVLDIGCGSGSQLRRLLDYGAMPEHLTGIDLLPERIERARHLNPAMQWVRGSAHELPFADAHFDLVTTYTMFSSILDEPLRRRIAAEMWRVLKPGGMVIVYDFAFDNPRNPAVRGITRRHLRSLFAQPGAQFDIRRLTLAPPLARRVAPRSRLLALALADLKLLNTHLLAGITHSPSNANRPS